MEISDFAEHRWVVPAMGMLYERKGEKYVTLMRTLGASQKGMRQALDALMAMRLVQRNPGYGHPMRPEYVLTGRGLKVAEACQEIIGVLAGEGLQDEALSKWAFSAVSAMKAGPCRFHELAQELGGTTDRALVLCLKKLVLLGLVDRQVEGTYPPSVAYSLTAVGVRLARPVGKLASALR